MSQAFKLVAQRLQMDLQELLLLPGGHWLWLQGWHSHRTALLSASGPRLMVPEPMATSYPSLLLHAPLERADGQVHRWQSLKTHLAGVWPVYQKDLWVSLS